MQTLYQWMIETIMGNSHHGFHNIYTGSDYYIFLSIAFVGLINVAEIIFCRNYCWGGWQMWHLLVNQWTVRNWSHNYHPSLSSDVQNGKVTTFRMNYPIQDGHPILCARQGRGFWRGAHGEGGDLGGWQLWHQASNQAINQASKQRYKTWEDPTTGLRANVPGTPRVEVYQ